MHFLPRRFLCCEFLSRKRQGGQGESAPDIMVSALTVSASTRSALPGIGWQAREPQAGSVLAPGAGPLLSFANSLIRYYHEMNITSVFIPPDFPLGWPQ
jgi:hypothetical protein